jgi:hypothetical protein
MQSTLIFLNFPFRLFVVSFDEGNFGGSVEEKQSLSIHPILLCLLSFNFVSLNLFLFVAKHFKLGSSEILFDEDDRCSTF